MTDKEKIDELNRAIILLADIIQTIIPYANHRISVREQTQVAIKTGQAMAIVERVNKKEPAEK